MTTGEPRRQSGIHAAAHAAHRLILEQHTELRRLLALGLVQTCMPSHSRRGAQAELKVLACRIRALFLRHLADEEVALAPLFDADRAGTRREEHARQQREMEVLQGLADADSAALAERFDGVARALLIDIAEEERELALAVAVLDERTAA
jgi:hemerythrin HHE cation binding domain-containing protein